MAFVRRGEGGDVHDAVLAGVGEVALRADQEATAVVHAAVGHGEVDGGAVFFADFAAVVAVVDACDFDGFAGVHEDRGERVSACYGGDGDLVGGDED